MLRRVIFLFLACILALAAQAAERPGTATVSHYEAQKVAISLAHVPSLWQERRGLILGTLAVVVMQSAFITWLLVNRATRRRAERARAENEERMWLATESADLGLWVWDIARDDFWVTPRFRSMFAFGASERISFDVFRE